MIKHNSNDMFLHISCRDLSKIFQSTQNSILHFEKITTSQIGYIIGSLYFLIEKKEVRSYTILRLENLYVIFAIVQYNGIVDSLIMKFGCVSEMLSDKFLI